MQCIHKLVMLLFSSSFPCLPPQGWESLTILTASCRVTYPALVASLSQLLTCTRARSTIFFFQPSTIELSTLIFFSLFVLVTCLDRMLVPVYFRPSLELQLVHTQLPRIHPRQWATS